MYEKEECLCLQYLIQIFARKAGWKVSMWFCPNLGVWKNATWQKEQWWRNESQHATRQTSSSMVKLKKKITMWWKNYLRRILYLIEERFLLLYSLVSIRQNLYVISIATIWHEILSWFLTIFQDLPNMITKLFLFWFSYQCRTNIRSQQTRTGKRPRNLQTMPCQMMAQVSK